MGGKHSGEQGVGDRKNLQSGGPSNVRGAPSLVHAASLGPFGAYLDPSIPTSSGWYDICWYVVTSDYDIS
jgi:hypothetical protein